MQDQKNTFIETLLAVVAALFCLYAIFNKILIWFEKWISSPTHQIQFAMLIGSFGATVLFCLLKVNKDRIAKYEREKAILGFEEGSVYCGKNLEKEDIFIKLKQRAMHTQVIGTTSAGKTESVIVPWAIQDIRQGRGLILIDGKADNSLLEKLYSYVVLSNREKDFRLISLSHVDESHQFNPLIGGTPEEITERVFNSFEIDDPYYKSVQLEVFSNLMRLFANADEKPTFQKICKSLTDIRYLDALVKKCRDTDSKEWGQKFRGLSQPDREQKISGLLAALSQFAYGNAAQLFNAEDPHLTLEKALEENLIVYFQLPVLLSPALGKSSGKMILQCLQNAIANRHRGQNKNKSFFSVYLDDFSEYLYPGFVSILNKSRSANVGVVFAHQALGDINALGDAISNSILTNSNIKIFMRGNDPESAEYFSKVIGTVTTTKKTERHKKGVWESEATGDTSVREAEEFIVHPNTFKKDLGVGEAIMLVPHSGGTKMVKIKFDMFPDLQKFRLPLIPKISKYEFSQILAPSSAPSFLKDIQP